MNKFCLYCTSGDKSDIASCEFRYCPFYIFRKINLDWQIKEIEREKRQKVQKARRAYKRQYRKGSKARVKAY